MAALFEPFELKGVSLRNRIAVSPMCQYMAVDGVANDWHRAHYAGLARGGAGLVIVEATAVAPEGRITWGDLGLWNDEQAEALAGIVREIRAAGAVPGIQIAHAGRKASANRPWEGDDHIPLGEPNSWETISASALAFGENLPRVPREMTEADIARVQADTVRTVERARAIGFEWLELHMAHGYLAQNFFSPVSNQRRDGYGGNAENRSRYLFELFERARDAWGTEKPITVRLGIPGFDGHDEEVVPAAIRLLNRMREAGLHFVDVSMGFNTPKAEIPWGPALMADTAARVRRETGLPGATSWLISGAEQAEGLVRDGALDLVMLGRPLLENPHWPYAAAKTLGVENPAWATLPPPYAHWLARYR
ncbi:MAG: NADH:flavin oxidoreductase/NADH oxidase [Gluconacetobacter diazotrophicus]|nr:NADH:flavin oxidoreductase/NADH oxidase [Gluconacetobacter diazotrophicus]